MAEEELPSSQTLRHSSPTVQDVAKLDLSTFPPIFVSATHFDTDNLHEFEEELVDVGATLTYDIKEAEIILSKVLRKPRILFDLRAKGLSTEEVKPHRDSTTQEDDVVVILPPAKKRKLAEGDYSNAIVIDDESTASEGEDDKHVQSKGPESTKSLSSDKPLGITQKDEGLVKVVKVSWFEQSRQVGKALPLEDFLTYQGRRIDKHVVESKLQSTVPVKSAKPVTVATKTTPAKRPQSAAHILERAREDASQSPRSSKYAGKHASSHHAGSAIGKSTWAAGKGKDVKYAHLLQQTTTEHDDGYSSDLPEMPDWVKAGIKYACQRTTLANPPNDAFVSQLKRIKLARLLTNDEIGVRAYSTSIAALAAYPHKIVNPREILALPGCDAKIANLYVEHANTGKIQAVEDVEADEDLKVLRLFYEIWGVGATTARDFYYDRGWRELDDIVDYGWSTLTRVQQIGVKYYDEFLDPISRAEVEQIGRIVSEHACKVRDDKVQTLIVGGYRRGKEASGDVDMIVSHPDEQQTLNIVNDIVASLEDEGWITHTLLLSLNSTNRGQQTLPFKSGNSHGTGFDTLDKALVVWQNPHWPTKDADLAADPKAKNPNIHRRVDIIVSSWRTVGCAVTGWSGGTIFQRDLRRYAKNSRGWKFDSSGVRDRSNGEVIDLEGWSGGYGHKERAKTMVEAEKKVFEGMGLDYREPWERCTG